MGIGVSGPRWQIKITHIPTGIEVARSSNQFRHQYQARDSAIRYLRSRLYMLGYSDHCIKTEIIESADERSSEPPRGTL